MLKGSKKGNGRADEVTACFAFERFDISDEPRETIFNPRIVARCAVLCISSTLYWAGLSD